MSRETTHTHTRYSDFNWNFPCQRKIDVGGDCVKYKVQKENGDEQILGKMTSNENEPQQFLLTYV